MLLSSAVLVLLGAAAYARPTQPLASVLTSSASFQQLPVGKTPLSRDDMAELARLAIAANTAYCPDERDLEPHPARGKHRRSPRRPMSRIIVSSTDVASADGEDERPDMNWYISHTPSTSTLTLAFSSLPSVDSLLELLASSPPASSAKSRNLVPLPTDFFSPEDLPPLETPLVHHAYLPAMATHGSSALLALLELLDAPPSSPPPPRGVFQALLDPFGYDPAHTPPPIQHVEIVGHGLGAAVGLLSALALHLERPSTPITATLFGLPRVGDPAFAAWVDALSSDEGRHLRIHRVASYADTIAHLPARHLDLAHPALGEIWVGADPRAAYACKAEVGQGESRECSSSLPLNRTSLLDHAGPFGGVWIGRCQSRSRIL